MRKSTMVAAALAGAALFAAGGGASSVGDKPTYKFGEPVDNGAGITTLESLRGKPTLIEFWGTY